MNFRCKLLRKELKNILMKCIVEHSFLIKSKSFVMHKIGFSFLCLGIKNVFLAKDLAFEETTIETVSKCSTKTFNLRKAQLICRVLFFLP